MNSINESPFALTFDEMPDSFVDKAVVVGVDIANSLLYYLPGFQIVWVPVRFKKHEVKLTILAEYDGTNMSSLAVRFNMKRSDVLCVYNKYTYKKKLNTPTPCRFLEIVRASCGERAVESILKNYYGKSFHVPASGKRLMIAKEIRADFTGDNHLQLAIKYTMAQRQIYRIVSERTNVCG